MGALDPRFSLCFCPCFCFSPLSLLPFALLFALFSLSPFLPWFGWDPGWIRFLFLLLFVAVLFASIAGEGFVGPLLRLVDGVMDPLQTCDTKDCAWTTLEDLHCETNWGTGSFTLPQSCARFHRVLPNFFTCELPGSCFENGSSVLLCLSWYYVVLFRGARYWGTWNVRLARWLVLPNSAY